MRLNTGIYALLAVSLAAFPQGVSADDDLASVLSGADNASTADVGNPPSKPRTFVLNPKGADARDRWAAGISYTGLQLRYYLTPRWAAEGRFQFGGANGGASDVHAQVMGLRGYRFYPFRERWSWYAGAEGAYAKADAQGTNYSTKGFALGGFGGVEFRAHRRVAVDLDAGPYVISLRESQTGLTQTGLDFVINTALNF